MKMSIHDNLEVYLCKMIFACARRGVAMVTFHWEATEPYVGDINRIATLKKLSKAQW